MLEESECCQPLLDGSHIVSTKISWRDQVVVDNRLGLELTSKLRQLGMRKKDGVLT